MENVHGFIPWFSSFIAELKAYETKRVTHRVNVKYEFREKEKAAELKYRKIHGSVFDVLYWEVGSNLEFRNDDEARAKNSIIPKFRAARKRGVVAWDPS